MILLENTEISGWKPALRGMRNPMNSWDKSDTIYTDDGYFAGGMGEADHALAVKLANAGPVHGKFLRMITVTVDIIAPMYWYTEFDTYKVGVVRNSCSKMHKLLAKPFTGKDFSHEKVAWSNAGMKVLCDLVSYLNELRTKYMQESDPEVKKHIWYQILQLLPESYNQRSTVMLNYAVLRNIFEYRKDHKLDEWHEFCDWIKRLPYSELITGEIHE